MDYEEMSKLRKSVPSVWNYKALEYLKTNISDTTTSKGWSTWSHACITSFAGNNVKKLLILESKRGPLSGYEPALSEVVDYLDSVSIAFTISSAV